MTPSLGLDRGELSLGRKLMREVASPFRRSQVHPSRYLELDRAFPQQRLPGCPDARISELHGYDHLGRPSPENLEAVALDAVGDDRAVRVLGDLVRKLRRFYAHGAIGVANGEGDVDCPALQRNAAKLCPLDRDIRLKSSPRGGEEAVSHFRGMSARLC